MGIGAIKSVNSIELHGIDWQTFKWLVFAVRRETGGKIKGVMV